MAVIPSEAIEQVALPNQSGSFLLLEPGQKLEAHAIVTHIGGGAVNAAISLKRQGLDVAPVLSIGQDVNGDKLLAELKAQHIPTGCIHRHPNQPTAVSVMVVSHDHNAVIFTRRGANGFMDDAMVAESVFEGCDLVYITNLSNQSVHLWPTIVSRAKAAGAFVVANPGILQLTNHVEDFLGALHKVDVFICNRDEASRLVPPLLERADMRPTNGAPGESLHMDGARMAMEQYAGCLGDLGLHALGITDGAAGAWLFVAGKRYFQAVVPCTIASTAGAGDAFASTLAGSMAMGLAVETALERAARNAAAVIENVDAHSGLLWW